MAVNERRIRASRERVWQVLSDGWLYSNWVVGTSHMRAVEAAWPDAGSRLFHASGAWPLATRDDTLVEDSVPAVRLALLARGRPFGKARVILELDDDGPDCHVIMRETPVAGPGAWLHNPVADAILLRRNVEALDRLAAICESRTEPSE